MPLDHLLKSIGLVLLYLAAAKVGLLFGTINNSVTIFWPPGGIALAVLLLAGLRYLPAVFVGASLAGVMVDAPVIFGLGSAVGNTLETWIGYVLLRRIGKIDLSLSKLSDLFVLIGLGGLIPAIASAVLGPVSLLASGVIATDALPAIMWRWWRADVLGIAFFTPIILVCVHQKASLVNALKNREILALWGVSFVVGQVVLLGWAPLGLEYERAPGLAWLFPLLAWAGLRTGRRNAGLIQLMFLTQALLSAHLHTGYFADDFARYGLANFWMFAMLLAVVGMGLAVQSSAQRRVQQQVELHARVFSVSSNGVLIVDAGNVIVAVNPAFTAITGYAPHEVVGQNPSMLASGKHDAEFYRAMWRSLSETGRWEGEIWNRRKSGEAFLEYLNIHTLMDARKRVLHRVGIFTDITQSKAEHEAITYQAQHDYLTNLPNRLLFSDRFTQQLAFANRHGKKFAVIYFDLDRFKPVNDALGHHFGDQLLVAVADRLTALVREIDTVSRFGGDEFAILVSEVATQDDAVVLAEKILAAVGEPFILQGQSVTVSASLGIALYPDHGRDMDTIMHKADEAMYQAKQAGSGTYVVAGKEAAQ